MDRRERCDVMRELVHDRVSHGHTNLTAASSLHMMHA